MSDHDLITGSIAALSIASLAWTGGCLAYVIREIRIIHGLQAAIFLQLRQQGIDITNTQDLVRRLAGA